MKSKILSQRIVLHIIHIVVRFMNAHTGTTGGTSERELKSPTVSSVSGSAEAGSDEVWIRVRCEETTRHLPGAVKRKKYNKTTRTEEETRSQTNTRTNQVTGWESVWHAAAAGSGSGSADHLDALVAVFKGISRFLKIILVFMIIFVFSVILLWFVWCLT